jgi:hypothetical protein
MSIQLPPHFDLLEWVWVAASVIALVASAWNLKDARADRRWVKRSQLNGLLDVETKSAVVEESIRVVKSLLLLAAGILVLWIPNPAPPLRFDLVNLFRLVLIATNLAITASAVWVRHNRTQMSRYRGGSYYSESHHPARRKTDRPPLPPPSEE